MRNHGRPSPLTLVAALLLAAPLAACNDNAPATTENRPPAVRHANAGLTSPDSASLPALVELFAPAPGDRVGVDGVGWFVDIAVEFDDVSIPGTGFTANQLTGPGVHTNASPFPGSWGPGKDDRFPGFVTLISTSQVGVGSCQNLSNLYNITGVTNKTETGTEIWSTWIIGAPSFGRHVRSTIYLAEVADLNGNGIYDDAPDVVPDVNNDGKCDATDLQALGLASTVVQSTFFIR
jgi:hypothetical protein